MDPLSQAALGAVVAQSTGHRQLGLRVVAVGAVAGAMPDIDVLFSINGDFIDQLITHRGITHSLFFAPVVGPLLGWLVWKMERPPVSDTARPAPARQDRQRLYRWMLVVSLAILSHPLLDLLTPYGTQLLQPFSDARFAINAMPIIDPVYTLLLLLGLGFAWRLARAADSDSTPHSPAQSRAPQLTALLTLIITTAYLGWGWALNRHTEVIALEQLAAQGIRPSRLAAFPTVLQIHYRRVVARLPDQDMVGYYSNWAPCEIKWRSASTAAGPLLDTYRDSREGRVFDWFSMGWTHYTLRPGSGGYDLTASDLRYGLDEDPGRSVFSLSARLDLAGLIRAPIAVGRNISLDAGDALTNLLTETYTPVCRFLQ